MGLIGPDEVEHEVRAVAVGRAPAQQRRTPIVDDLVGAELSREPPPTLVGVDGDHRARSQLADELQRNVTDAAHTDEDGGRAGDCEMRDAA